MSTNRWVAVLLGASLYGFAVKQVSSSSRIHIGHKLHGIKVCPPSLNHATTIYNYSIGMDQFGMDVMDINGRIDKKMISVSKVGALLHRCRGGTSSENCEYVGSWFWDKAACALLAMKNVFWTPLVDSVSPAFKCPMENYDYTLKNASLDMNKITGFIPVLSLESWLFKVQFSLWNEKRDLVLCIILTGEMRRRKIRN